MNLSDFSIRKKLLISNGLGAFVLIALCFVVFTSIQSLNQSSKMVQHTHEVIAQSNGLVSSMVDMETGLRGFSVGGQDDYLEPYLQGQKDFQAYLKKVKQLTSDNPTQQRRFDGVSGSSQSWLEYAETMIALRRDVSLADDANHQLQALLNSGVGKERMDALRANIATGEYGVSGQAILTAMINMETGLRGFMLHRKQEYLEPYNAGKSVVDARLRAFSGTELEENTTQWVNSFAEQAISLVDEANKHANMDDLYAEFAKKQGKQYMDKLRVDIAEITAVEDNLMNQRTAEAEASSSMTVFIVLGGGTLSAVVLMLLSTLISRSITKPISEVVSVAESLSDGDLRINVEATSNNEIGQLQNALGTTISSLREIVSSMSKASIGLTDESGRLTEITSQTSKGSQTQLNMTSEVATAMEEMSVTVSDVAQNASEAVNSAKQASEQADSGMKVVQTAIESIKNLEQEVDGTSTKLTELESEAENIGGILDVIRGIAEQTNLLALNAAIEAARAGEQGRGFAVVADEVRSLAGRTQEATAEIQSLIERLQHGSRDAVSAMHKSRDFVELSVSEANKSGEALQAISKAVSDISLMNASIASAAEQQSATAGQINQSVASVNDISQSNSRHSENMVVSSENLNSLADTLGVIVSKFKL